MLIVAAIIIGTIFLQKLFQLCVDIVYNQRCVWNYEKVEQIHMHCTCTINFSNSF